LFTKLLVEFSHIQRLIWSRDSGCYPKDDLNLALICYIVFSSVA